MPDVGKAMEKMGWLYEKICKIPVIGIPLVKAWNRFLGGMIFRAPPTPKGKKAADILEVKDYLLWSGEEMNFPFEVLEETIGPDSFEFTVGYCPYGYKLPRHEVACDATMEMDRSLFGRLGAELIIKETVIDGAPKCKMLMKWQG